MLSPRPGTANRIAERRDADQSPAAPLARNGKNKGQEDGKRATVEQPPLATATVRQAGHIQNTPGDRERVSRQMPTRPRRAHRFDRTPPIITIGSKLHGIA